MRRLLLLLLLVAAPRFALAAGTTMYGYGVGGGSWSTPGDRGTYVTQQLRATKMQIRDRPVQFLVYAGYRFASAGRHTFHDIDFGAGARVLPHRPLVYSGSMAVRFTASATLGVSLVSLDTPLELSAGVAMCANQGDFGGVLIELVARPTNEPLATQSNSVSRPGQPGVIDLGPSAGMRFYAFF